MQEMQQSILPERATYGGFWPRVGAYMLDGLVVSIPLGIVMNIFSTTFTATTTNYKSFIFWFYGSWAAMFILYYSIMESSKKQATIGKMALNLQVTDMYGNRPSFARSFGRCLSKFLSAIILGIGFLMVGWDNRKQGLHDKIAGTLVVKKS